MTAKARAPLRMARTRRLGPSPERAISATLRPEPAVHGIAQPALHELAVRDDGQRRLEPGLAAG